MQWLSTGNFGCMRQLHVLALLIISWCYAGITAGAGGGEVLVVLPTISAPVLANFTSSDFHLVQLDYSEGAVHHKQPIATHCPGCVYVHRAVGAKWAILNSFLDSEWCAHSHIVLRAPAALSAAVDGRRVQ